MVSTCNTVDHEVTPPGWVLAIMGGGEISQYISYMIQLQSQNG